MSKVLVVDDDITTQMILQSALEEDGHCVRVVSDGQEGFATALQWQPDLVISDWVMPEMDGLSLCHALKCEPQLSATFFILLTAREQLDDRIQGLDAGADDFLAKPVEIQELLARVRAGLRLSQANQRLNQALQDLQQTQARLVQTEKMSSLGQMVAGIAHEINNPITFILGNLPHLRGYVEDLIELLTLYQAEVPQPGPQLQRKLQDFDPTFVQQDAVRLMTSMHSGATRVQDIVQSLRRFSLLDEADLKPVNLNDSIETTLLMLQHRFQANGRPAIALHRDYSALPLVECYAKDLNQVFLNVLTNAIDALEERCKKDANFREPQIWISTSLRDSPRGDRYATLCIGNNGPLPPQQVQAHMFDPFFTTKPVGQGVGMGLAISYQIVVQQHQGVIRCQTTPPSTTEFVIQIPLGQAATSAA
ncbi:response regulator [Geitlerinema sp. PCC 7407]|uniref:hybrid sensor histidine kinase/response regulator n=1 Tax=Geitlerinema sp. PCC 7407 TaxID=1173025 RepID=UPI00029F9F3C|nr:response regulator [Geitlerinema sp. PCC 7407]AFY68024.1 response regulator receiver sensor signal transduction histidine kinase [Geitlerinema sp. PCC 7407]